MGMWLNNNHSAPNSHWQYGWDVEIDQLYVSVLTKAQIWGLQRLTLSTQFTEFTIYRASYLWFGLQAFSKLPLTRPPEAYIYRDVTLLQQWTRGIGSPSKSDVNLTKHQQRRDHLHCYNAVSLASRQGTFWILCLLFPANNWHHPLPAKVHYSQNTLHTWGSCTQARVWAAAQKGRGQGAAAHKQGLCASHIHECAPVGCLEGLQLVRRPGRGDRGNMGGESVCSLRKLFMRWAGVQKHWCNSFR